MARGIEDKPEGGDLRHPLQLMNIEEAAAVLKVSVDWLARRVAASEVPHTRLGKFVRFTERHLQQIIEQGEHGIQPPSSRARRTPMRQARQSRSSGIIR